MYITYFILFGNFFYKAYFGKRKRMMEKMAADAARSAGKDGVKQISNERGIYQNGKKID